MTENRLVEEGDQIILRKGKAMRNFQVVRGRHIWLDKTKFMIDGVIGHQFGTNFEVKGGKMVKINKNASDEKPSSSQSGKDNRNLIDADSNQKLSKEDIDKMKEKGMGGEDIIHQLIENSSTFQSKTEYSQAKYIKKKKLKHILVYNMLKPTSRLVCEMLFSKNPTKVCNLRLDSLAQILTYGNIGAHRNVGVVDTCMGLLVGAVMERMGGNGKVVHFYHTYPPQRQAVDFLDLPEGHTNNILSYPINKINLLKLSDEDAESYESKKEKEPVSTCVISITPEVDKNISSSDVEDKEDQKVKENENTDECMNLDSDVKDAEIRENAEKEQKPNLKRKFSGETVEERKKQKMALKEENRLLGQRNLMEARKVIKEEKLDCLIIVCKFNPVPILLSLIDYVLPSRPVVVFSQYKEAVMDCYAHLRERGGLVSYKMSETWLRNYQVMEMRTHPEINMSGGSGYLFTATTVEKE